MKAVVVYDSFFGNTEQIARAIGDALGPSEDVSVLRVGDVKPGQIAGLDLLIVGSPTRAFSASPDTKAWLKKLGSASLKGIKVAGFDTRVDVKEVDSRVLPVFVRMFGYAAEPISEILTKKGGVQAAPPEGFIVLDKEGPLKDGELKRAAAWARQIASSV
jgi:flavodoxin